MNNDSSRMKDTLRILIVGCGSMGKRHLRNLRCLGYRHIAVCRSRQTDAGEIEREFGIRTYFQLEEAFRERPVVAVISNPTALHVPAALEAAKNRCHLFIEKPVSHILDGTAELLALVEHHGLVAAVGYNLRFHPALQMLRELVLREEVGRILSARAWASQYLPDWHPGEDYQHSYMARADLGGGVILTLSHEFDYLCWMFGQVKEVTAVAVRTGNLKMATENLAEVTLVFGTGVIAQVHLDCLRRTPSRGCELIGTEGTVQCDLHRSELRVYRAGATQPKTLVAPLKDPNRMYLEEMSRFLECIRSGVQPEVSLKHGINVMNIAVSAQRAASTGIKQRCL